MLNDRPPLINMSEKDLTRKARTTLIQLRSGHCRLLGSYKSRTNKDASLNVYGRTPRDIKHLFNVRLIQRQRWTPSWNSTISRQDDQTERRTTTNNLHTSPQTLQNITPNYIYKYTNNTTHEHTHTQILVVTLDPKLTCSTHITNLTTNSHEALNATAWGKQTETFTATYVAALSHVLIHMVTSCILNKTQH